MAETIYLEPILKNFFSDRMSELNYCLPARIENTQNIKEGRIDVKPLFIPRYLDNTYSELPVVKNVPVVFPSSNESGMVFTPKQGDTVLLFFAQCNIDNFKGGSVEPYSTVFDRSLDINDAVAIVGFSPFNKKAHLLGCAILVPSAWDQIISASRSLIRMNGISSSNESYSG